MSVMRVSPCPGPLTVHPLRLGPGAELKSSLMSYVKENKLEAAFIMTCCGSLTKATLRLASHTPADGNNKVSEGRQGERTEIALLCSAGRHLSGTFRDLLAGWNTLRRGWPPSHSAGQV